MGKSRAWKPTLAQKILMEKSGLDARDWLVIGETPAELQLASRGSGTSRVIKKAAGVGAPCGLGN